MRTKKTPKPFVDTHFEESDDLVDSGDRSYSMQPYLPTAAQPAFLPEIPTSRQYGLGGSLLIEMGYREGHGLGAEGRGIVYPLEARAHPGRIGLGGIREMAVQAGEHGRRPGQSFSDDEVEETV